MSELRVGIIGCGRMGRERARCVSSLGHVVHTVFDVDDERCRELAAQYGAHSVIRLEDCFRADLDAIFICTAPGTRGTVEIKCIQQALPIFVEKPIGISATGCEELLLKLEQRPVVNAVGYMNRYRASVLLAQEILRESNILGFSAQWVCKRYNVSWWQDERTSGGPHNDQATHLFDLGRFLIGEVAEVQSLFVSPSRVATLFRFEGHALGTAFYSCEGSEKDIGMRIFTTQGSLALEGWDFRIIANSVDGRLADNDGQDVFLEETSAFLGAVRSGNQDAIACSFADAAKTQRVLDAARRSSQILHSIVVEPVVRSLLYEA